MMITRKNLMAAFLALALISPIAKADLMTGLAVGMMMGAGASSLSDSCNTAPVPSTDYELKMSICNNQPTSQRRLECLNKLQQENDAQNDMTSGEMWTFTGVFILMIIVFTIFLVRDYHANTVNRVK